MKLQLPANWYLVLGSCLKKGWRLCFSRSNLIEQLRQQQFCQIKLICYLKGIKKMIEHKIKGGDSLSRIAQKYDITLNRLLSFNSQYKANPGNINIGDVVFIPKAQEIIASHNAGINQISSPVPERIETRPSSPAITSSDSTDDFTVTHGQLTFDVEGMETPGRYFSRKLHVPTANSGITIGRGYDMKERSSSAIFEDMTASGVAVSIAKKFAMCGGYKGKRGKDFIQDNNLSDIEISPSHQKLLFTVTYDEMKGDVLRICNKADVIDKYGETNWEELDPIIRDIAIDLRYRGDYKPSTREAFQPILVANNRSQLDKLMADERYWINRFGVPKNRFNRRRDYK